MQETPVPLRRLASRRHLARATLVFESVWRGIWPALMLAGVLLSLALLNVLPALGGLLHTVMLAAGGIGFLALLIAGLWKIRWPDAAAVDRRLETRSGLRHRPLSVTIDKPAVDDPLSLALWQAHRDRTLSQIRSLRVGLPRPGLAFRDPRALRFAVLLLLIATLGIANVDAPGRLAAALNPVLPVSAAPPAIEVQAWITPPAYTGLAPIFLRAGAMLPGIPVGSHLTINISGSPTTPSATLGDHPIAFRPLDGGSFQAEDDLHRGGTLTIRDHGATLGAWPLSVVADEPPHVAWGANPGARDGEQRVRLPWDVSDDYGVTSLQAELRLADRPDAPPLILPIPLPGGSPKAAHGISQQDLTANPWAGLPVIGRLMAHDALQQTGESGEAAFRLPERPFRNPIARALIAARKSLSLHPDDRGDALEILDGLMQMPQAFENNHGGFAILGVIYYGLVRNHADAAVPEAQDLLWKLALSIEEGLAAETGRTLEQARQKAREAMDQVRHEPSDANREALMKRLEELKQAIDRHMEALMKQLQAREDLLPEDQRMMELSNRDLDRMANEAEQAVREGRMDQAQQQMAELEKLLDKLRSAHPANGRQSNAKRQNGRNQTSAVQEMIAREGGLLDHAQQRGAPQQRPGDPAQDRTADERVQRALRRGLGELMQQFTDLTGEVSPNLGAAERAMQEAQTALSQGNDSQAGAAAQSAIAALQQGRRDMQQALSRMAGAQAGQDQGSGEESGEEGEGMEDGLGMTAGPDDRRDGRYGNPTPGSPERADSGNRDPLGRQTTGNGAATGDVEVPEDRERNRTQAINEELRRRDADRQRSQEERDYIGRLLKQF